MTQVNLLPADVQERQRTRRLTAAVILAVGAVVVLLFFVFVLQAARLSDANHRLSAQQAANAELQTKIAGLQEFAQLKSEVAARQVLTASAMDGEVLWSSVLRDVSMVIPDKVWLTGMSGTLNPVLTPVAPAAPAPAPDASASPGAAPAPGAAPVTPAVSPEETLIGSIQFQGMADDHPSVAQWLTRVEQVTGWVNAWITNATEVDQNGDVAIQWSGSIDLSGLATVQGGPR
jgi:Tfp pilus assembly protein PilN